MIQLFFLFWLLVLPLSNHQHLFNGANYIWWDANLSSKNSKGHKFEFHIILSLYLTQENDWTDTLLGFHVPETATWAQNYSYFPFFPWLPEALYLCRCFTLLILPMLLYSDMEDAASKTRLECRDKLCAYLPDELQPNIFSQILHEWFHHPHRCLR